MNFPNLKFTNSEVFPMIVFEGIDGSGTSTHAKKLIKRLPIEMPMYNKHKQGEELKLMVTDFTFEPSDSYVGREIREDLKTKEFVTNNIRTAVKFAYDRAIHINSLKERARNLNTDECKYIPIVDRYFMSSMSYQALLHPEDVEFVLNVNSLYPIPYISILIDPPVSVAMGRIDADETREGKDYIEKEKFQVIIKEAYNFGFSELQRHIIDNNINAHVLSFTSLNDEGEEKTIEELNDEIANSIRPLLKEILLK